LQRISNNYYHFDNIIGIKLIKSFHFFTIMLGTILLLSLQNQIAYAENQDADIFSWIKKPFEIIWQSIVKLDPVTEEAPINSPQEVPMLLLQETKPTKEDDNKINQIEQFQIFLPMPNEVITTEPDFNGKIIKKFTYGDTEIIYSVRVENGIEQDTHPDVLRDIWDSGYYQEHNSKAELLQRLNSSSE